MHFSNKLKIGVLGSGSWATAFVDILIYNNTVQWYVHDDISTKIIQTHTNPKYLSTYQLNNFVNIKIVTSDLDAVIQNSDILFICIPAQYIQSLFNRNNITKHDLQGKYIISLTKGYIPTYGTVTKYFTDYFDIPEKYLGIITGPSHAEGVINKEDTYLTFFGNNIFYKNIIQNLFTNLSYIHIDYCDDNLQSIQYFTIFKNIYAISCGIFTNISNGDNYKAAFISKVCNEIQNILKNEFNTNIKNFNIPAYLGDLLVTCYSTNSRNYKFGKYIITTNSINTALQKIGNMHVEGYDSLKYIHDNHVIHNIQKYLIFSKLIKKIFIN